MIETKILGDAVGIQRGDVIDKSETTVLPSLSNGVITGHFKRGRMDRPFKVTASNYKALLGHDPSNPSYLAVEDAFKNGVSEISVLRTGGRGDNAIDTEMPEVEPPWPPELVLPVKLKAEADSYGELTVVINFEGGSAQVDFGDGSDVLDYTDSVEHTYPASLVEDELVPYSITLTPTSRIPLLSTDIRELTDWGSAGSVKRFKFLHSAPTVPDFIPPWLTDTSHMFEMCQGFSQDLSGWDVSNVTNMSYMFKECRSQSSDLSNWDVSKVTDMKHMFEQAGNFSGALEDWDTSNVTDMSYMFSDGAAHNAVVIGSWDVSKVTDMNNMFNKASSFNCDLSAWDVSNVVDMSYMFAECHALFDETTPVGYWSLEKWDVSKVTNMERMFYFCFKGVPSNISRWQTGNVTNMKEMFSNCQSMNHLTFWDTSKVTTMEGMFKDAYQFNSDISNWDVSNVTNMDNMFKGVQWLVVSLDKWCVEKISEEPTGFAPDADYMPVENRPAWGTCPSKIVH